MIFIELYAFGIWGALVAIGVGVTQMIAYCYLRRDASRLRIAYWLMGCVVFQITCFSFYGCLHFQLRGFDILKTSSLVDIAQTAALISTVSAMLLSVCVWVTGGCRSGREDNG
jgi:hypothetical protein